MDDEFKTCQFSSNVEKKRDAAFVFDVWRTSVVRSVSGFDSRVATHEIARSTDPPVGRIGLNVNVRQDRQDGFPVRRARATPHAPFRRRCDSVRIATNARVCARRDSPCGPARGSRGAGQRDAGKRKSTSRLTRVGVNKRARARQTSRPRARAAARRELARAREMDGRGAFVPPERASATRGRVGTRARDSERARNARRTADDSGRREAEFETSRDTPVRRTPGTAARSPRGRTPALSPTSSSRRPRSCGRSTVACAGARRSARPARDSGKVRFLLFRGRREGSRQIVACAIQ